MAAREEDVDVKGHVDEGEEGVAWSVSSTRILIEFYKNRVIWDKNCQVAETKTNKVLSPLVAKLQKASPPRSLNDIKKCSHRLRSMALRYKKKSPSQQENIKWVYWSDLSFLRQTVTAGGTESKMEWSDQEIALNCQYPFIHLGEERHFKMAAREEDVDVKGHVDEGEEGVAWSVSSTRILIEFYKNRVIWDKNCQVAETKTNKVLSPLVAKLQKASPPRSLNDIKKCSHRLRSMALRYKKKSPSQQENIKWVYWSDLSFLRQTVTAGGTESKMEWSDQEIGYSSILFRSCVTKEPSTRTFYRPLTDGEFFYKLQIILDDLCLKIFNIMIMGDFNSNIKTSMGERLLKVARHVRLENGIEEPSRITKSSDTTIDLTFTSNKSEVKLAGGHYLGISDLHLEYALVNLRRQKSSPVIKEVTDFKNLN
ncbi:hypothetical protein AWC38_SpisGene18616 [Stylophora pistillata]|uniref:Uncharacterized protein n=1 Tax=Stylophora pistillata TaxID=50429 RepID=A0A2B4RJU5_STYPI|nr:hypothetical protein AWC38_SpisGene18616 [Stylophora pistillata]